MSIFILFQNLYYLFETYISMKLIMMDDLDMRVHKKVYIFLKDQYKQGNGGCMLCCAIWSRQASMGRVRNSLKISFRQLYVDRLEVVGKKKGWPSILFLLPTAMKEREQKPNLFQLAKSSPKFQTKKSRPNFRENVGKMNQTFFVDLELRDSPHIKKRIEMRKNNEKLKYTYMR